MVDSTIPGKSLDAQFDAMWKRFERLSTTTDSISDWPSRIRRWIMPVNVSFVIPIEDAKVCEYLGRAQEALMEHMAYAPQPSDKLHITLYQLGYLRSLPFRQPGAWSKNQLQQIATLVRQYLTLLKPFEVQIGPMNAFPNVAIAEVHDFGKLRLLYSVVARAVPPIAPLPVYPLVPHVTLGYFGRRSAAAIRNTIRPLRDWPPVTMTISRMDLTLYYRKPGPYDPSQALLHSTEEVVATLPLGGSKEE